MGVWREPSCGHTIVSYTLDKLQVHGRATYKDNREHKTSQRPATGPTNCLLVRSPFTLTPIPTLDLTEGQTSGQFLGLMGSRTNGLCKQPFTLLSTFLTHYTHARVVISAPRHDFFFIVGGVRKPTLTKEKHAISPRP